MAVTATKGEGEGDGDTGSVIGALHSLSEMSITSLFGRNGSYRTKEQKKIRLDPRGGGVLRKGSAHRDCIDLHRLTSGA